MKLETVEAFDAVRLQIEKATVERHGNDTLSTKIEHARRNAEVLLRSTWLMDLTTQKPIEDEVGVELKSIRKQYFNLLKESLNIMGETKGIEAKVK